MKLTLKINGIEIVCPFLGGEVKLANFDGVLRCPDYNLLCTSEIYCDSSLDCVRKKQVALKPVYYSPTNNSQATKDVSILAYMFDL